MSATPSSQADSLLAEALNYHQTGRLNLAIPLYRRLLAFLPWLSDALHLLALAERHYPPFDLDRSAAMIRRAIVIRPDHAAYRINLCDLLRAGGWLPEAEAAGRVALILDPGQSAAYANYGNVSCARRKLIDAAKLYRRCLALSPDLAQVHSSLGNTAKELGLLDRATSHCQQAIALDPGLIDSYNNLGLAESERNGHTAAHAAYRRVTQLDPTDWAAHSNLLMCLAYREGVTQEEILTEAQCFGERFTFPPPAPHDNTAVPLRKLRVGYVSGDFVYHPVGWLLEAVLRHHHDSMVETICYSNNGYTDGMTERLQSLAGCWRDIQGQPDQRVEELVRADGIDILVDLSGHTAHNRLPLFARKPAPVQVTWLGYWGSTGLLTIDYLVSDATTIPTGEERFYREQVVRLPSGRFCYTPPDYAPYPARNPPVQRAGHITFGCFNNLAKIGPKTVALWARVLHAVPNSMLLLKWRSLIDPAMAARLRQSFETAGINPDRLVLRIASPHAEMLAQYGDVDIALDPVNFSGGITSCEALWMGVPVVTMLGKTPPSRQTASLLRSIGVEDWIAADPTHYIQIAIDLAAAPASLGDLRQTLRPQIAASALCNSRHFTLELENIYRELWRRWCETRAAETP